MRKHLRIVIVVAIVVTLSIAGIILVITQKDNVAVAPSSSQNESKKPIDSCTVFTKDIAKSIMGDSVMKGVVSAPTQGNDVNVSTCSYTINTGDVATIKSATLMVRSPLTSTGVDSNKMAFGNGIPTGAEKVPEYGDDSYWDIATGTLNVLKDDYWYSIAYGGLKVESNTLDQVRPLADKILK